MAKEPKYAIRWAVEGLPGTLATMGQAAAIAMPEPIFGIPARRVFQVRKPLYDSDDTLEFLFPSTDG